MAGIIANRLIKLGLALSDAPVAVADYIPVARFGNVEVEGTFEVA